MVRSPRALAVGLGLVALTLVPVAAAVFNQPFYLDHFRRIMIFAIAALSLDLILGYGGMVSFGHAAYLGIGAYAVGVLAHHGVHNGFVHWALAIVASALVALAIGAVSIRTSGVYFIMITLAFTQMLYYLGISIEEYGGDDGMRLAARSQFGGLLDLRDGVTFYYLVLAVLALSLLLGHRFVNARFGMVVRAARSNEARARAIGFSPYRYKLAAFVMSGAMCGVAGALLVNHTEYLTPEFMHWTRSGEIMFMVILGGMGTLAGPVIGAVVLLLLEDLLSGWTVHWQIILGPFLVLVVLFAKRGLFGLLPELHRPKSLEVFRGVSRSAPALPGRDERPGGLGGPWLGPPSDRSSLLEIRELTKTFGGLIATNRVDLGVLAGETHAVIGPNGAGKTTLIAQIAGDLTPDSGTIRFAGRDVTGLGAPARSHLGLARSFQITSVFREFSALDNVALAVQAHAGHSFRFWRPARTERALREPAQAVLATVGLGERAHVIAATLAHGEQRQLEIAMALATGPRLLLLDEPMAGMGLDESQRMIRLLSTLKRRHTILLVEHDMDAVFALADRISVMVYGRVIATGTPEEIRANTEVRAAYLGEDFDGAVGHV